MLAVRMTLEQVEKFFLEAERRGLKTPEERDKLLREYILRGEVQSVAETQKTKEEYMKHMAEHFEIGEVQSNGTIKKFKKSDD